MVQNLTESVSGKLNLNEETGDAAVAVAAVETGNVETAEEAEKKRQRRGGKGLLRDESSKLDKEALKRAVKSQYLLVQIYF